MARTPNSGNPANSTGPGSKLTVKQEREQRRLAKLETFKREQAKEKRNRLIAIVLSSVAALAVVGLIVTIVVTGGSTRANPDAIEISDVQTWADIDYTHTNGPVDYEGQYEMNPPAGGSHNPAWLNCGVYTEPQQNENAVHALEHGALWFTYNPDELSEEDVAELRSQLPDTYIIVSPYPGLDAPVVASGWGVQLKLTGVDDERIGDFITKYWQAKNVPEPGARCDGAINGPGKVA